MTAIQILEQLGANSTFKKEGLSKTDLDAIIKLSDDDDDLPPPLIQSCPDEDDESDDN